MSGVKIVDLPLNTTEDMLIGSLDFETAVRDGRRAFSGGLLERADGNILYVDEVNLLPDSIVSTLICASVSGENLRSGKESPIATAPALHLWEP
ncbi:MAG: hypothetical protein ACLR23_21115 [Clostridia bacterium]